MTSGNPPPPRAPVPRYGECCLPDFTSSLLAALGVPGATNVLDLAPAGRACVLLVDGLGDRQLRAHPGDAPFLTSLAGNGRVLTASFPSTTATSLASLGTAMPPGGHGIVGYLVAVPGTGRLMNSLRWDDHVDPVAWQPQPTVFERAAAAGVTGYHVAPAQHEKGGLTRATQRGARYVPADSAGELVAGAAQALRQSERAFVSVYYGELDATGHRQGCGSAAWRFQLAHVDRLAEQLASVLPPGTPLYIIADHGMIDVDPELRVDADEVCALRDGVALLGGDPRARYVYTQPGAADDVLAMWRELVGDRMWVVSREEAIGEGWFGPRVSDLTSGRIGDVVAAARDRMAVVASQAEPRESKLIGWHGSLTDDELLVPLLIAEG